MDHRRQENREQPQAVDVPIVKMHGLGNDFVMVSEPLRDSKSYRSPPSGGPTVADDEVPPLSPLLAALAATSHTFPSYVPAASRARSVWAGGVGHVTKTLCTRRFGVGADGLTLLLPPFATLSTLPGKPAHHFRFELYNPDGSAAPMCGNALRCAAKLVWERRGQLLPDWLWAAKNEDGKNDRNVLYIETPAGTMVAHLTVTDGGAHVTAIRVDMGKPDFARSAVPCTLPSAATASLQSKDTGDLPVLEEDYVFEGVTYQFSSLIVGVPHTVVFVDDADKVPLYTLGPALEKDRSIFPQGTNVGFVQVLPANKINYWAWERGVGETLACGTGASAAAVVATVLDRVDPTKPVHAHLTGGDLTLRVDFSPTAAKEGRDRYQSVERVWMEGPADVVFDGVARVTL